MSNENTERYKEFDRITRLGTILADGTRYAGLACVQNIQIPSFIPTRINYTGTPTLTLSSLIPTHRLPDLLCAIPDNDNSKSISIHGYCDWIIPNRSEALRIFNLGRDARLGHEIRWKAHHCWIVGAQNHLEKLHFSSGLAKQIRMIDRTHLIPIRYGLPRGNQP